jgi:hypothetical protein
MESCQIDAGKRLFRCQFAVGKLLPGADGRSRFQKWFRTLTEESTRELQNADLLVVQCEEMQLAGAR